MRTCVHACARVCTRLAWTDVRSSRHLFLWVIVDPNLLRDLARGANVGILLAFSGARIRSVDWEGH